MIGITDNYFTNFPTKEEIENCKYSSWDHGNKVLYDLCRDNFYHQEEEKILSKVWLVGRAYSAALERRRNKEEDNDEFYIKKVVPAFKNSNIDNYLNTLKAYESLTFDNLPYILKTHKELIKITFDVSKLEKRSFSSKYLHFHFPNLFFIYDSRVVESLREYITKVPKSMEKFLDSELVDVEYAKFLCKCFILKAQISSKYNIDLTLRQFDNLLIGLANKKPSNNKI